MVQTSSYFGGLNLGRTFRHTVLTRAWVPFDCDFGMAVETSPRWAGMAPAQVSSSLLAEAGAKEGP